MILVGTTPSCSFGCAAGAAIRREGSDNVHFVFQYKYHGLQYCGAVYLWKILLKPGRCGRSKEELKMLEHIIMDTTLLSARMG